ncbi:MAG TPA: GAF domain-containing protein [Anaerolineales bacterium]|nr:GAF domain-containing protein [Anaerolineales bacterium]
MILTRKLIAPAVILFILLLAGLFAYFFASLHEAYHEAEEGNLASFNDSFAAEVENQKQLALALASEAAGNPMIQEAFAAGEEQRLLELAIPSYEHLKESNGNVIIYQYHFADGTLFIDVNDPADPEMSEVTRSRATLLANQEQKPVAGLESENGDLGIQGVVPVFYQGKHIGSVEYGIGLNQILLLDLKEKYGGEWRILLSKNIITGHDSDEASPNPDLMVFATTQDSSLFNEPESYTRALTGVSSITHPSVAGRDYAILSAPIYDYSEQIIGVLDIVYDHTHISAVQNTRLLFAGLASFGALFVGILGLVYLTSRTLQPIQMLTRAAAEIAEGSVSSYVNLRAGDDEIGILVNAFNRMTTQLRSSIMDLEQRVANRTQDLESQTLRLRAAAEIARDVASIRELDELLERSAQSIVDRFNFYHVGIFILDRNKEFAVLTASPTEAGREMLARNLKLRVGEAGIVERVAATGEPRLSLDAQTDTIRLGKSVLAGTRSEMALPLKVENQVMGVLDIQSDQSQAFSQDDIAILQVMADQLATAIERTRLSQELERNLSDLRRAYGQYTREGWRRFSNSGRIINQGYRFDNIRIEPINELPAPGTQALHTGTVVHSNSTDEGDTIAIPIKLRGQTIGVVNAKLKEGFGQNALATIESAVERLATALESARLYEEASLRADREQAISQVTSAISASTGYEEILRMAVLEIGTLLNDTEVAIQILQDSDDQRNNG